MYLVNYKMSISKMNNIEIKNSNSEDEQKKVLLREFRKTANQITPSSGIRGLKNNLGIWFRLNTTILMQRIGYNKRKISTLKEKEVILNIGCENSTNNNYINTDLFPSLRVLKQVLLRKEDFNCDLFLNLPYYDQHLSNFAHGIVLSHVLEHISPTLAITSLRNCFNYLKQGGHIRISVPYLEAYDRANIPLCQGVKNRTLAKNKLIYLWQHRFMYDAELLGILMEKAGFREVKEVTFGEGILAQTDIPSHQLESIYLTGAKPLLDSNQEISE